MRIHLYASFVTVLLSQSAHAYKYAYSCNGYPSTIGDQQIQIKRHSPSIPTGTMVYDDLLNTQWAWRYQSGVASWTPLIVNGTITGSSYVHGDGIWSVGMVNRSNINNNNGMTKLIYGTCVIGPNDIDEADIMVANDLPFGNPDESQLALWNQTIVGYGRMTFVHEWGHALGLDHADTFDVMRNGQPDAMIGGSGSHVAALGDSRSAIGNAYGYPSSYTDVAASVQWVSNGLFSPTMPLIRKVVTAGQTVKFRFTIANLGTQAQVVNNDVRLSQNPNVFTGILVTQVNSVAVPARGHTTVTVSVAPPVASMACNTDYYVIHNVDSTGNVAENDEWNNFAHNTQTLFRSCP